MNEGTPHWSDLFHIVTLAVVPKFFEWLGWIAAVATLQYLAQRSESLPLLFLLGFSYLALLVYFNSFFIELASKLSGEGGHSAMSLRSFLAALLMALAASFIATQAIGALTAATAITGGGS